MNTEIKKVVQIEELFADESREQAIFELNGKQLVLWVKKELPWKVIGKCIEKSYQFDKQGNWTFSIGTYVEEVLLQKIISMENGVPVFKTHLDKLGKEWGDLIQKRLVPPPMTSEVIDEAKKE